MSERLAIAMVFFVMVFVATLVFGGLFWLFWNAIVPDVFGLPSLTFPQATGLFILIQIGMGTPFGIANTARRR
jgi:hypothetical protein